MVLGRGMRKILILFVCLVYTLCDQVETAEEVVGGEYQTKPTFDDESNLFY